MADDGLSKSEPFYQQDEAVSIKIEDCCNVARNGFRKGISTIKDQISKCHPLENSEKNFLEKKQEFDFKLLSSTLGSQTPFAFKQERMFASQIRRLPCLSSSFLHLEVLLGRDDTLDFSDFLQDSYLQPTREDSFLEEV
ncbi:hypothetical protein HZS_136 [Henneguya salminicola]|nr:hypothetical protein HZS_136 [Henneguya salminicola]